MAVFYRLQELPAFGNPVITLGTFDGVHLGHRAILEAVIRQAQAAGGQSILITFEPHPRKVLFPEQELKILTPLDEKVRLIQEAGIEHVVVAPFTKAFSQLSADKYIEDFLVRYFHPEVIVIGHDHHFGHDRKGNIALLEAFAAPCGFKVCQISEQLINDAAVSSTKIRKALAQGAVVAAREMLGRPYSFKGSVVHGQQLGAQLGYPTANLEPLCADQLLPANGVYAITALLDGQALKGMMNIGVRPTVSKEMERRIEAHLFGFSAEIYGRELEIFFVEKLRDEQRFPSIEVLQAQLQQDEAKARSLLERL